MSATLKVTRADAAIGIELRRGLFDIQLDGRSVGSIRHNQTVETSLEPGHHTLQMRKGRYSSKPRSFDVTDGETANFRTHGEMVWPQLVASFINPDLAISLKPA
jgi:hypothetical protein